MAEIASWLRHVDPSVFVVDVSVEVASSSGSTGSRSSRVAGPGERGDPAHLLGFDVADALVGCWPPEATGMLRGVPPAGARPGASRRRGLPVPGRRARPGSAGPRRVALLSGTGGHALDRRGPRAGPQETPDWEWTVLDRRTRHLDRRPVPPPCCDADVVVTHAGQNALAEVAAARTPAVVVPQPRPHREQEVTAEALWHDGWPAVVVDAWPGRTGRTAWTGRAARRRRLGLVVRRPRRRRIADVVGPWPWRSAS